MRQAFLGRSALGFAALAANFGRPTQSVDAVQTAIFSDYPGGRQDLIFAGSGNLSWTPDQTTTLSAGVRCTQQLSSHPTSTGTASICCLNSCST